MNVVKILFLIVIALVAVSVILSFFVKPLETSIGSNYIPSSQKVQMMFTETNYPTITLKLPAVDNEGNGVITDLKVQARPGSGRVLTDINQLFFWVDTQNSIRIAQRVAQNVTGINISKVDLVYAIETNASLIEGPSAGAALTVATIAALENKTLSKDVMMTGTIDLDGSIGKIGEVAAKAKAAKEFGAKLFLVPSGQGSYTYYKPNKNCQYIGSFEYCTTKYEPQKVNVTEDVGIKVVEVFNVREALKYFLT